MGGESSQRHALLHQQQRNPAAHRIGHGSVLPYQESVRVRGDGLSSPVEASRGREAGGLFRRQGGERLSRLGAAQEGEEDGIEHGWGQ